MYQLCCAGLAHSPFVLTEHISSYQQLVRNVNFNVLPFKLIEGKRHTVQKPRHVPLIVLTNTTDVGASLYS